MSGFLSNITQGASNLYHSATDRVTGAAHTVGGLASDAYHGVANTATSAYNGAVNLTNTASGYIQRAEGGITHGLHAAEDWVDHGTHALAGRVANVPVLGGIASGMADQLTAGTQILGGMVGGATTMVGGIANAALHPISTAAGVEAMVEHSRTPLGTMARGGHDLIDVARGQRSFGSMINRAVNPLATAREDAQFWGRMGSAIIDPYRASVHEGRYGEALGRGVFDIGSMLIGAGEAGEAGRGAAVAGEVGRTADVAEAARAAGTTADAARAAGTTGEAVRATGTTTTRLAAETTEATRAAGESNAATEATRAEGRVHAPAEPDVGLADRGERPAPGTRFETREQYHARRSRERAEATVRAADQPLENPVTQMAQEGHGHARHGFETTDAQQAERVRTGRYPDDPIGPLPAARKPAGRASRFTSPEAEAEALGRGRHSLNRRLREGTVPTHPDPVTGAPTYVDPVNGKPVRVEAPVTTNRPGGFGTSQVPQRNPPPSNAAVLDPATGQRIPIQSPTPLPNASTVFEHVPSTGQWHPVTYFPEPAPIHGNLPLH